MSDAKFGLDVRASVLGLSALAALGVGGALVVSPRAFRASYGVETENVASALSEIRAPGGALLALGFVMALGVFRKQSRQSGLVVAAATLLGYAFARLVSIGADGFPSGDLLGAALFEGIVGIAALLALFPPIKHPSGKV